jgi:hypothetical protein
MRKSGFIIFILLLFAGLASAQVPTSGIFFSAIPTTIQTSLQAMALTPMGGKLLWKGR